MKNDVASLHERSIMPRSARSVSAAQRLIKPLVGHVLRNEKLGISGALSGQSINKLGGGDATRSSSSPRLHAIAVANVDILFMNAEFDVTHPNKHKNRNVRQIHRLGALMFDDASQRHIPVMLTVKEFIDGTDNRIYTIEAIDAVEKRSPARRIDLFHLVDEIPNRTNTGLEKRDSAESTAARTTDAHSERGVSHTEPNIQNTPNTEFNNKIHHLLEKVNAKSKKIK